jgi:hypothetical protein
MTSVEPSGTLLEQNAFNMLTLEDINGMPSDPEELTKHLAARGLLAPPPTAPLTAATVTPATVAAMTPAAPRTPTMTPAAAPAGMSFTAAAASPHVPSAAIPTMTPPTMEGTPPAGSLGGEAPTQPEPALTPLTKAQSRQNAHDILEQNRPKLTAKPGTPEFDQQQAEREQYALDNPWGSAYNHPGTLGKIGHTLAKIAETAGTIYAPTRGLVPLIPGTEQNLKAQERGDIANFQKAQTEEGINAEREAQTRHLGLESDQLAERATPEDRKQFLADNPDVEKSMTPFEKADYITTGKYPQHEPTKPRETTLQQDLAAAVRDAQAKGIDPAKDAKVQQIQDAITSTQKETKPDEDEKKVKEVLGAKGWTDTPANRLRAREVMKQLGKTPEDEETRDLKKEILRDRKMKLEEPTADETRRADLGRNMLHNLDEIEEIAKRRPELFGKAAGRWTELRHWAGTDDQDIARLYAVKEYLGMASVGAHAMRNAQHVETAANAILNSFHNSPAAVIAAAEEGRESVGTFLADERRRHNRALAMEEGGGGEAEGGGAAPAGRLSFAEWQAQQKH